MSEQQRGQLREVLTVLAGLLVAFGVSTEELLSTLVGLVMAGCVLHAAFVRHEGRERTLTAVRKFLSLLGGALVTWGVLEDAQVTAILGAVGPVFSMAWSWRVNCEDGRCDGDGTGGSGGMGDGERGDASEGFFGEAHAETQRRRGGEGGEGGDASDGEETWRI